MSPAAVASAARVRALRVRGMAPWHAPLGLALRLGDALIVAGAGLWTYGLRHPETVILGPALLALVLGVIVAANCFALAGLYGPDGIGRLSLQVRRVVAGWTAAMGALLAVLFLIKLTDPISRLWIASWYLAALIGLLAVRAAVKLWITKARASGALVRRLAIVRDAAVPLERIMEGLATDPSLEPVADIVVDFESVSGLESALAELHLQTAIEQVLLAPHRQEPDALPRIIDALRHLPLEVNLVAAPLVSGIPVIGMRAVGGLPATVLLERPVEGLHSAAKSIFDRVLAASFLLFCAPLLAIIALAIKLDSPGPVLFRQTRLGFGRQRIEVLKFRTMRAEACDATDAAAVTQATREDPRVTRVGRLLRRTSLDELPQLWNVLKGEMSLVGPRPHALAHDHHYAELIDGYLGRHRVKPGITGWAQIHGCRGETRTLDEMRRRIELDLYYIDNWSLLLDIRILLRTLLVGFISEKAY